MTMKILSFWLCIGIAAIVSAAPKCELRATNKFQVHSSVLNDNETLLVRLPTEYCTPEQRFPVIYLLDADMYMDVFSGIVDFLASNQRIPAVIIIGITHRDRNHDLTPTLASGLKADGSPSPLPTSGGGPTLRLFLSRELIPMIDKQYRTEPYRVLVGHSLGGLFAIDALINQPELFRAYLAASPSLWWDHDLELRRAATFYEQHRIFDSFLYLSIADESDVSRNAFQAFTQLLSSHPGERLAWKSQEFVDEEHVSSVLPAFYYGLRAVFAAWPIPKDRNTKIPIGGLGGLESHYARLSKVLGYKVPVPEQALISLGNLKFFAGKTPEAVAAYQRATELYPKSADAYDHLGTARVRAGDYERGRASFRKAIELAQGTPSDPNLAVYSQHLRDLEQGERNRSKDAIENPHKR